MVFLCCVRILTEMKDHINFIRLQGFRLLLVAVIFCQFKIQLLVSQTACCILNIVSHCAAESAVRHLYGADACIIFQESDADGPMLFQPFFLLTGKNRCIIQGKILLIQICQVKWVIVFQSAHGIIQFFFDLRMILVDCIINARFSHIYNCGNPLGSP